MTFENLRIPDGWIVMAGVDTGTYMSASITVFDPEIDCAFTVWEGPNYRYVGGEIELLGLSNSEWATRFVAAYRHLRPKTSRILAWCDPNTQFRAELAHYGIVLQGNPRKLELRVEISREYVHAKEPKRWYHAPWLSVLPYEMEYASWPDDTTTTGRFERIKRHDHTLDTVEHVLSRRPRGRVIRDEKVVPLIDRLLAANRTPSIPGSRIDPHLGRH